ncbi:hypothetical protein Taro_030591 [Colocasia esculenta]|uniref:Protein kinase domain-containing protein n=1 Tax=Colocasia esculenta TaxID=4460 RepID=A0A843VUG3_COLES|nr:hypothetical protein [Colocasia esculenta]
MEFLARESYLTDFFLLLLVAIIFPVHLAVADLACNATERELLSNAFASVAGFDISLLLPNATCRTDVPRPPSLPLQEIRLPSRNLRGTVSWMVLRNISSLRVLDLSGNALRGSIPAGFWSAPGLDELNLSRNRLGGPVGYVPASGLLRPSTLRALNLSGNRFTNTVRLSGFPRLTVLDLSQNNLRLLPLGIGRLAQLERLDISGCNISGDAKPLAGLRSLRYLDASRNRMSGSFPDDFPPMVGLKFLNISFNNFTGKVTPEQIQRFGVSAFAKAGVVTGASSSPLPEKRRGQEKKKRKRPGRALVWGMASSAALLFVLAIAVVAACIRCRRRTLRKTIMEKNWTGMMRAPASRRAGKRSSGKAVLDMEAGATVSPPWVAELTAGGAVTLAAAVVMFEKPLMQLTFSELAAATSGFGVESQLAEGRRSGPVYRAVLPGELDVVVKVLGKARDVEAAEARAAFQDLGGLKHSNILPLLGYCIAGREKLLLYEYMDNGDLHRWLHELPAAGCTDLDDWSTDTWEHPGGAARGTDAAALPAKEATAMGWGTRHRIALGIARGLAFLHHAGSRPVVHGHLVPSNVLLDEELEPRIADFGTGGGGDGSTEEDVYCYGSVLVELLTGRVASPETVAWVRGLAKGKEAARCLDPRLRRHARRLSESEEERAEKEMVEALRVAFLCTAESPEKRPSMRQVVGLLKDVRDTTVFSDRVTPQVGSPFPTFRL